MNKYITVALSVLAMLVPVACSSDTTDTPENDCGPEMREINVNMSSLTRTSIEYENVDLSHLVWSDGDKVAYISDAESPL